MAIDDGGQAFPRMKSFMMRDHFREPERFTNDVETEGGMTLRDWIAGQAASSVLGGLASAQVSTSENDAALVAESAYRLADAMIAARKVGGE